VGVIAGVGERVVVEAGVAERVAVTVGTGGVGEEVCGGGSCFPVARQAKDNNRSGNTMSNGWRRGVIGLL